MPNLFTFADAVQAKGEFKRYSGPGCTVFIYKYINADRPADWRAMILTEDKITEITEDSELDLMSAVTENLKQ